MSTETWVWFGLFSIYLDINLEFNALCHLILVGIIVSSGFAMAIVRSCLYVEYDVDSDDDDDDDGDDDVVVEPVG